MNGFFTTIDNSFREPTPLCANVLTYAPGLLPYIMELAKRNDMDVYVETLTRNLNQLYVEGVRMTRTDRKKTSKRVSVVLSTIVRRLILSFQDVKIALPTMEQIEYINDSNFLRYNCVN